MQKHATNLSKVHQLHTPGSMVKSLRNSNHRRVTSVNIIDASSLIEEQYQTNDNR